MAAVMVWTEPRTKGNTKSFADRDSGSLFQATNPCLRKSSNHLGMKHESGTKSFWNDTPKLLRNLHAALLRSFATMGKLTGSGLSCSTLEARSNRKSPFKSDPTFIELFYFQRAKNLNRITNGWKQTGQKTAPLFSLAPLSKYSYQNEE